MRTKLGIHISILVIGIIGAFVATHGRSESRQAGSELRALQIKVSVRNEAEQTSKTAAFNSIQVRDIEKQISKSQQNLLRWTLVLWFSVGIAAIALFGIAVETNILKEASSGEDAKKAKSTSQQNLIRTKNKSIYLQIGKEMGLAEVSFLVGGIVAVGSSMISDIVFNDGNALRLGTILLIAVFIMGAAQTFTAETRSVLRQVGTAAEFILAGISVLFLSGIISL